MLLCLSCIHIPAGIFRPIQIQYTFSVVGSVLYLYSGRNIPSNTNTIQIYCCCVCLVFIFWPEFSGRNIPPIQIQYTFIAGLSVVYFFPAGKFRPESSVQYNTIHIHCCCVCLVFIFRPEFSDRNIQSNTNTIHIYCCCVCFVFIFRPEFSVLPLLCNLDPPEFRPEYGIPAGIQIQYKCNLTVVFRKAYAQSLRTIEE